MSPARGRLLSNLLTKVSKETPILSSSLHRSASLLLNRTSSYSSSAPASGGTNFIQKSPQPPIPSTSHLTVQELVRSNAGGSWANNVAYECSASGLKYTFNELFRYANSFATAALQAGLKRGDVAVILLPNCPQYAVISHALMSVGIIVSPLNPLYTPNEIANQVVQCQAKAVITIPPFVPVAQAIQQKTGGQLAKTVITVGEETPEGCHNYSDMIKVDSSGTTYLEGSKINTAEETALILWSSGTTGPPKGACLSHFNLTCQMFQITDADATQYTKGDETLLGLLPFFHVFGNVTLLNITSYLGGKVVTMPNFDPTLFTKVMKTYKPTITHVVPPLISFMLMNPAITKEDFARLHTIVCGGATTGAALIQAIQAKADKPLFFQEAYGMTELTGGCHMLLPRHGKKPNSIGVPLANTESKIVDVKSGVTLGPNTNGEILVRGPQVMKGYLNNEEATKNMIDSDGWLHTGDIGYYTDEGFFYVVDRLKELIKVKGFQVSPSELEGEIRAHPKVADVAVIGIPDERAGELPRAYVVPKDPSLTEAEIHEFIRTRLTEHKHLAGGIQLVKAVPKSASGKILRKDLREDYKNSVASNQKK